MRTELGKLGSEERHTFTAIFERKGTKRGYKGTEETVLLKEIRDEEGNLVADHQWFNMTKGFERLHLKPGDKVQFGGRVDCYERGYFGRRLDVYVPESVDFKISYPTKIKKITEE